eukprot:CAMPEP_0170188884 /NCGR_PEP_ID=MMETSP0040_2-20121228/45453_1 /TAXON_ID=641309 /ORGANISM="Lotharella oceanica, Strain CCMP622" /LENGTH=339 /DNA_ID=CAMNT_0010436295 /DNA_START=207 /DNA_END=1226 /DNA_ORIENTATION=+
MAVRDVSRTDFTGKIAMELAQFKESYLSKNTISEITSPPSGVETTDANASQRLANASQRLEFEASLEIPAAVANSNSQPSERSIGRNRKRKMPRGAKRFINLEDSSPFKIRLTQLDLKAASKLNKKRRIFNRTRRACVLCHKRKVRCKPNPNGELRPCFHCFNDGRTDCVDYIPPARRSSVEAKTTVKKPPKEKALADHMNRHRGIPCHRTVDCSRPYKHPGHCKTGRRSALIKKTMRSSSSSQSSVPVPMPVWTNPLNLNASMGPLELLNAVPMVSDALPDTAAERQNQLPHASAMNDASSMTDAPTDEVTGAERVSDIADVAATLTAMSTIGVQVAG